MNDSRRTALLLSVLGSAAFWLLVDYPTRVPEEIRGRGLIFGRFDPALSVIPGWKKMALIATLAVVLYGTACLVHALGRTPRQRRLLWPLAIAVLIGSGSAGWHALGVQIGEDWRRDHYLPLRLEREHLAGSVWRDVGGGDCGYIHKEVIVFESETRAVRYRNGAYIGDWLLPLYAALDVWPHGEWTASGEVRDGVITWRDEDGHTSRERLHLANGELTLTWID